jgi:beta-glucosidase
VYKQAAQPVEKRVADLLRRMTIEEKAAQLMTYLDLDAQHFNESAGTDSFVLNFAKHGLGLIQPLMVDITREVSVRNAIQRYFMQQTRLGIPVLFAAECGHGLVGKQATGFPTSIALGATWNPALIENIFSKVAAEARTRGIHLSFTPTVDLVRDPRWGRTEESFSEDVFLSVQIGNAVVRGLQGGANGNIGRFGIGATLKAFVGHSQPDAGVNRASVTIGENELRNTHMRVFEEIIATTKPAAIMPAYNAVDGIFMHMNQELLRGVLRKEWGYKGLVVSDWSAIRHLHKFNGVSRDTLESAMLALRAGVDLDQAHGENYAKLPLLVKKHPQLLALVDEAVRNVLRYKFALGLFENPYINEADIAAHCNLASTAQVAYESACQSMVLLHNKNNVLPLNEEKIKSIALIGAHADNMVLGGYSGLPVVRKTLLNELTRRYNGIIKINYSKGFEIYKNYPRQSYGVLSGVVGIPPTKEEMQKMRAEAYEAAKHSDVIVLVLGEDDMLTHETWTDKIPGDHATIDLEFGQLELLDTLSTLGKPIIVYMMNGRPLNLKPVVAKADAVLEGWYAGQEGAVAAWDILFGKVNPSGKLPVSFPVSTGQLPMYYNHKTGGRNFAYVQEKDKPLFPFGFGMSYTSYQYSNLRISQTQLRSGGKTTVSIDVRNAGSMAGDEIVQLYIRDVHSSIARPILELKAFERVHLKPGETKTIQFTLTPEQLKYWKKGSGYIIEPGLFNVYVGPSSDKLEHSVQIEYI